VNPVVSTTDTTRDRAARLLAALGDTPAAIARTLVDAGIRGDRCNEGTCPIATYLMRSDLGLHSVAVSGNIATLRFGHGGAYTCLVRTPDAVEEFIERFDEGGFSELLIGSTAKSGGTR
jgi:hypothetical protein